MIRIEAAIRLSREITFGCNEIKTGFRVTIKVDDKGYITQLVAKEGQYISLDQEVTVYMDILYGELEIEKFLNNVTFEFVEGKKYGEGQVIAVKEIYIENTIFEKVDDSRRKEIMSIIENIKENSLSNKIIVI